MLHIDFMKYWRDFFIFFIHFNQHSIVSVVAIRTFKMSSPSRDGDDITSSAWQNVVAALYCVWQNVVKPMECALA